MPTHDTLLKSIPFFESLAPEEMKELSEVLDEKIFPKGETIFQFGRMGDSLYIVLEGEVELFIRDISGDKILLTTAQPGEFFGELSLFDQGPRTATAIACEESKLLILHRQDLLNFLKKRPDASLNLLAILSQRIRKTNDLLQMRVVRNVNEEIDQEMTRTQRMANAISSFSGSIPFLILNVFFFTGWVLLNTNLIPFMRPFDPYPFGFLTMAVSLEAIFLSIFVLLAQNLQASKDRLRSNIEYEINLKAELEITYLHKKIDQMNVEIMSYLHHMKKNLPDL